MFLSSKGEWVNVCVQASKLSKAVRQGHYQMERHTDYYCTCVWKRGEREWKGTKVRARPRILHRIPMQNALFAINVAPFQWYSPLQSNFRMIQNLTHGIFALVRITAQNFLVSRHCLRLELWRMSQSLPIRDFRTTATITSCFSFLVTSRRGAKGCN